MSTQPPVEQKSEINVDMKMEKKKEMLILSILDIRDDLHRRVELLESISIRAPFYMQQSRNFMQTLTIAELKEIKRQFKYAQREVMGLQVEYMTEYICACYCDTVSIEYALNKKWTNFKNGVTGLINRMKNSFK
ncbi:unnamed protein product [Caenorhabditis brenneri]